MNQENSPKHRIIFTLIFSIIVAGFCQAQDGVNLGFKGGINYADFAGTGSIDFEGAASEPRVAFHIGALVEIPVYREFSLQPELLFSRQGFTLVDMETLPDADFLLDYVSLPVMAKYEVLRGFSILGGPQIGYLLGKDDIEIYAGEELLNYNFNRMDLGVGVGAEYQFQSFSLYGRYTRGFTEIVNISGVQMKNVVIQAGISFRI